MSDAEWERGEALQAEWERRMKCPRPVSIAAWIRLARRGQVWWPGKTFTVDLSNEDPEPDRCCDLAVGHDYGCEWRCGACSGSGLCIDCQRQCFCDDVVQCELCGGDHSCPQCHDGWITEDVWL